MVFKKIHQRTQEIPKVKTRNLVTSIVFTEKICGTHIKKVSFSYLKNSKTSFLNSESGSSLLFCAISAASSPAV